MAFVVLQQVSSKYAVANAAISLEKRVDLKYIKPFVNPNRFMELEAHYGCGAAHLWGAKLERHHQVHRMVPNHSLVLFRRSGRIFKIGLIKDLLVNVSLAERIWGFDHDDGETWGIIYLMDDIRDVSLSAAEINKAIGRKAKDSWRGMVSLEGPLAEQAINYVSKQLQTKP